MARLSDAELDALREARKRALVGAASTQRRDAGALEGGTLVPRSQVPPPTRLGLEDLCREIDAEEAGEADVDSLAASVVVALRARGWTVETIAERMMQPEGRVRRWLAEGIETDMVTDVERHMDRFLLPMAADVAQRALEEGDLSMAKEVLKGRGVTRKVLKEPGLRTGQPLPGGGVQAPQVLNLQVNVLPGVPGSTVAVGAVSGTARSVLPNPSPLHSDGDGVE